MGRRIEERRTLRAAGRRRRRGGEGRAPVPVQRLARKVEDTAHSARGVGIRAIAGDRPLIVAVIGVVVLGIVMVSGPLQTYWEGHDRVELLATQEAALDRRIAELERRRADLEDPATVELLARENLGYVRPGEIPYAIVPPEVERPQIAEPPPAEPAPDPWYQRLWNAIADVTR